MKVNSPVNKRGFIVFKEVNFKNNFPENGEDRLFYITKGTTNANAYF